MVGEARVIGPDMVGATALAVVLAGLAVTVRAQVRPPRRLRFLLDTMAIVPEWRFYAQASTLGAIDLARDTHLVVRDRDRTGRIGSWRHALGYADRRWHHAIWNPQSRVSIVILTFGEDLAYAQSQHPTDTVQQTPRYIVLLRRALEAPRDDGAVDRQFAVVHTIGRQDRSIGIDFLSAWHRW